MSDSYGCDLCGGTDYHCASYDEEACSQLGIGHHSMRICQECCTGLDQDSRAAVSKFIEERDVLRRQRMMMGGT